MSNGYYEKGYIYKRDYRVSMTRALGDCNLEGILFRYPSIRNFEIDSDAVVMVATDGIIKDIPCYAYNEHLGRLTEQVVAGRDVVGIGEMLGKEGDNTSIITLKFIEN